MVPFKSRRPRGTFLVALLLLTLLLAGVLAYQAQDAARSHREAAENALRDYAAFAAWEFVREVENELSCAVHLPLHPIAYGDSGHDPDWYPGEMPEPSAARSCTSCPTIRPRYYFRLDLRDGGLRTSGDPLPIAAHSWLVDTVGAHAHAVYEPNWDHAVLVGEVDGRRHLVAYHLERDDDGTLLAAYGLGADPEQLVPAMQAVVDSAKLLPPSLSRGMTNDSLLAVRVVMGEHAVYRSPVQYSPTYAAVDTLESQYGALVAQVAVRPAVAKQLVIGGLPASRLPLLLGLLALVAGLVLVALHQLRRQSELARLRSDFISGVSHELRTPLAQIRMFAETLLLQRVRSEGERHRSLEIIDQEAKRLTHLVENVLHFSRSERRVSRIEPEPMELASQVREIVETFAPLTRARQAELRLELEEGVTVPVDRDALCQMLLNLLDNALKYGPAGQTVAIGTALVGERVRIRVDDQGPGIPPRDRQRVWEAFRRLERDRESAIGGSGIGLSVVQELASLHGGSAWVEEAAGGGARFVVELPGAHRKPGAAPNQPDREAAAVGAAV